MPGITTLQIAKKLGLSRNTVSKALNNNPAVSSSTKQLVLSTAVKLGYSKIDKQIHDEYAQKKSNHEICLVVHDKELKVNFWNIILRGIEEYLVSEKCKLIFGIVNDNDINNNTLPHSIINNDISGIITVGIYSEKYVKKIFDTGIPYVSIDSPASIPENEVFCDVILTSNRSSVYEITQKAITNGCKNIAFVGDPNNSMSIRERWEGYMGALTKNNILVSPVAEKFLKIPIESDYKMIDDIIGSCNDIPDAFVCANDINANSVIKALEKRKIRIPEDVYVSGFDNLQMPYANDVSFTTVDYDIQELGYLAAKQILQRIKRPLAPNILIRTTSKVIRSKTISDQ